MFVPNIKIIILWAGKYLLVLLWFPFSLIKPLLTVRKFKCRVTPSRFPFRKEILRLITKEALPQSLWIYGKRLIFLPAVEGEYSTSGIIKSYPSGYFYGIGRQENFIGLGTMNYAGIGYVYSPGCWSFNLQAYTVKWSVPRRESQLLGLSGLLTYPVNEKIRLNTFASYSFILSSPFSSSNYGGFVSYDIIPNWGMDFGVRSHTDFPLHKTKTLPIVAPYFQYKGNKLGIDIGGGLFNLLFK